MKSLASRALAALANRSPVRSWTDMLYCNARFPRGAGLGTRLFPWARCVIYSELHGIPMLAPQWVQPRIGPLIRGGIDHRAYAYQILLLGLFRRSHRQVGGIRRLKLLASADRRIEPGNFDWPPPKSTSGRDTIIEFEGYGRGFEDLHGYDSLLYDYLRQSTNPRWLQFVDRAADVPIGINVRLGNDFRIAETNAQYFTEGALKTPITWFIDALQYIRGRVGFPARAVVVSDGTRQALGDLLRLENVSFLRPGCAISDLLTLQRSKVFLGAGGSSFSAWASYLGQMPTITHPGQSLEWFGIRNRAGNYVGEFDPAGADESAAQCIEAALLR